MSIFGKSAAEITAEDLQGLIDDEVTEDFQLDYKREIDVSAPSARKEFAQDVSGFANRQGGYLIYGIDEDTARSGVPKDLCGFELKDPDAAIPALENVLMNRVQPRIDGVEIAAIELPGGKHVLCVRVPVSWSRPHMVDYRFFGRGTTTTAPLDVTQVRGLYMLAHEIGERSRQFHLDRFELIKGRGWTVPLDLDGQFVFHAIPYRAFEPGVSVSIPGKSQGWTEFAPPINGGSLDRRHNSEGLAVWGPRNDAGNAVAGTQWFRNGILEVITPAGCFEHRAGRGVQGRDFEEDLFRGVVGLIETAINYGSEMPFMLHISGFGLSGRRLNGPDTFERSEMGFDRAVVHLPEAVIDSLDDIDITLKHVVDAFWQAGDHEASPFYDAEGRWRYRDQAGE